MFLCCVKRNSEKVGRVLRSFLLSVLGVSVAVGHRVDGIVSPEEKSAARGMNGKHIVVITRICALVLI